MASDRHELGVNLKILSVTCLLHLGQEDPGSNILFLNVIFVAEFS